MSNEHVERLEEPRQINEPNIIDNGLVKPTENLDGKSVDTIKNEEPIAEQNVEEIKEVENKETLNQDKVAESDEETIEHEERKDEIVQADNSIENNQLPNKSSTNQDEKLVERSIEEFEKIDDKTEEKSSETANDKDKVENLGSQHTIDRDTKINSEEPIEEKQTSFTFVAPTAKSNANKETTKVLPPVQNGLTTSQSLDSINSMTPSSSTDSLHQRSTSNSSENLSKISPSSSSENISGKQSIVAPSFIRTGTSISRTPSSTNFNRFELNLTPTKVLKIKQLFLVKLKICTERTSSTKNSKQCSKTKNISRSFVFENWISNSSH